jgi:hypothetical protein
VPSPLTLADIICNSLDKDYSVEQAVIDLGELMTERELIKLRYGLDFPRRFEIAKIIPAQEKLALGKLRGENVFEQQDQLNIRLEQHD